MMLSWGDFAMRRFIMALLTVWSLSLSVFVAPAVARDLEIVSPEKIAAMKDQALHGDGMMASEVGDVYFRGESVPADYIEAAKWYAIAKAHDGWDDNGQIAEFTAEHQRLYTAAKGGDPAALVAFADHSPHNATGLDGDRPAGHWLLEAATKGSLPAAEELGDMYLEAYYRRSHDAARPAGETIYNSYDGLNFLSLSPLDFDGESLETDLPNAIRWLTAGLDNSGPDDDEMAKIHLAMAYAMPGPTQDLGQTKIWLERAVKGDWRDENMCAYFMGERVQDYYLGPGNNRYLVDFQAAPDYDDALICASGGRFYPGDYYLGYLYHRGLGTARDDVKAKAYLETAVTNRERLPETRYELSRLYRDSDTVPHDPVMAFVLLRQAVNSYAINDDRCPGAEVNARMTARGEALDGLTAELAALRPTLSADEMAQAQAQLHKVYLADDDLVVPPRQPCMY